MNKLLYGLSILFFCIVGLFIQRYIIPEGLTGVQSRIYLRLIGLGFIFGILSIYIVIKLMLQKNDTNDEIWVQNDITKSQEITKDETTGGLDVEMTIDNSYITDFEDTVQEDIDAITSLPENVGQAGENVGKAAQNLADSVADNLSGNGNDGILEDYQGKTRNQELGLQSKIDKDLKAAIENLAENPEAAEAQLESLAKKVAKINGVEGDVDIEFYNSEDGAMGGHKDGKELVMV